MDKDKRIQDYIDFVTQAIDKYKAIGQVAQGDEISPQKVYAALSEYYNVSLMLNAEYQRAKAQKMYLELEFDEIYSEWFATARRDLVSQTTKSAKVSIKEVEQEVKAQHRTTYYEWQAKLIDAESKTSFYLRLRDTLNKYDSILVNMAQGLRSELRALSIENRANSRENFNPIR